MGRADEFHIEHVERRQRAVVEIMRSYAEYQATGAYVSADYADAWLDRLESGDVTDPPLPR